MIEYIPYKLATEIIINISDPNYKLDYLEPLFMDKRKFSKQRAKKYIESQINPVVITEAKLEIVNSGFTLELPPISDSRSNYIIVHHPDFPSTNYQVVKFINSENYYNFISLLLETGEIRSRRFIGTYYFDPGINFFRLENRVDKERIEKFNIGKALCGTWKKLIPGHEYYIEINRGNLVIKRVVFLGLIKDVKIIDRIYSRRGHIINYYPLGEIDEDTLSYFIVEQADQVYLFRDLEKTDDEDNYFMCSKSGIHGIDLGNTGETMSELEFYDKAVEKGWTLYINNRDVFKDTYSKQLIQFIDERGSLEFKPKYTPFAKYSFNLKSNTLLDVVGKIYKIGGECGWKYTYIFSPFTSIVSPYFYNYDKDMLIDILHIIYSHYGLNEN